MPDGALASARVVIVGGDSGTASFRYRVEHTREQLALAGIPAAVLPYGAPAGEVAGAGGSRAILFLHRVPWDPWTESTVALARQRGWRVIADTDDLVFDTAVTPWVRGLEVLPPAIRPAYDRDVRRYRAALAAADAITVPGEYLGRQAAGLGRPVFVLRNAASLEQLSLGEAALSARPPRLAGPGRTFGYFSGTYTHNYDFRACIDGLAAAMRRHPDARLLVVGPLDLPAGAAEFADRIQRSGLLDWHALPDAMLRAQINLAPLEPDNPFCLAKSELKYIEGGLAGLPTVASPTEAFRHAIADGRSGILASGGDAWARALLHLAGDPGLRLRLGDAARHDVYERYHPRTRALELAGILAQVAAG